MLVVRGLVTLPAAFGGDDVAALLLRARRFVATSTHC